MGVKSQTEMMFHTNPNSRSPVQSTADSQNAKKYLYNLTTAKYLKGYELLYREKEYFYWFRGNINYLIQFYTLWRREPVELFTSNRQTWYEWTEDKTDVQMVHASTAGFITTLMRDLVFSGPVEIKINDNEELNDRVQKAFASDENDIQEFLKRADMMESVGGTIMFKCNYDPTISEYPILEYYEVDKIDYMEKFGRITNMISVDDLYKNGNEYSLISQHTREGISYTLFNNGNEVPMSDYYSDGEEPRGLTYPKDENGNKGLGPILAVWKMRNHMSKEFFDMKLGASDYEGQIDSLQMLDEIYSRFINQIRATQPVLFMSEELMGFSTDDQGNSYVNKPKDLGVKVYELSGGLSNVDGKSIAAMFNRDVPDLKGVAELASSFEWVLRTMLTLMFIAPSTGNIDTEKVGSNTTSSSLFKREQSTHLLRKSLIESWTTAIKNIVRLVCQWFDIIDSDGNTIPNSYADLSIDVKFPDVDMDDFGTRLDQAVKGYVSGLFSIKEGVKHAFKNKLTETDMDALIADLEKQREDDKKTQETRVVGNDTGKSQSRSSDALSKLAKNESRE